MRNLKLSFLSGFLLALSWPEIGFYIFIFVAFVPILFLENEIRLSKRSSKLVFCYSFLSFFIFNVLTTFWVCYASFVGGILAFFINSLLMSFSFWLFHIIKKRVGSSFGLSVLCFSWLSMEYLHLNWELAWPWLILGNVFSNATYLIQWYEYTGLMGGSLWVLIVNILFYNLMKKKFEIKRTFYLLFILLFPITISTINYYKYKPISSDKINVVIVQPNIDPYEEKFNLDFNKQVDEIIKLSEQEINKKTDLLIAPETALTEAIWENNIGSSYSIRSLKKLQENFPGLNILIGATTYKLFENNEKKSITARNFSNQDLWYDIYNSAIFLSNSGEVEVYHKTKLVPGAETMPYPNFFDKIAELIIDLGGVKGSLGRENKKHIFSLNDSIKLKPLICYESVFGDLSSNKYLSAICVITNDGWWRNTPGYKQHYSYSSLRAIEQRKPVLRSANTGISGIISSKGEKILSSRWNEKFVFSHEVNVNNVVTFYNRFGDFIGRVASFVFITLLIISFSISRLKK